MFPILNTKRMTLRSFNSDDFMNVFELITAFKQQNEGEQYENINTPNDARRITNRTVKSDNEFIIIDSANQSPVGWVICDKAMGYKIGKRTYINIWIRDEYRHMGHGHEILAVMLNFAFYGIKTDNVVTNVKSKEEKAHCLMKEIGFEQYSFFPKKAANNDDITIQYILPKEKYTTWKEAYIAQYDYEPPKPLISPYSYDNPIRRIEGIKYVKQPTGYLCGQSVIAMLSGASVDEVIDVMKNDKGTSTTEIRNALKYYGIKTATKIRQKYENNVLPDCCILSIQLPRYGHWSLYYKGVFYDPEFGELTELPRKAKLCAYWEIVE